MIEIIERLVRVETRLDSIESQQREIASDLRIVRDHVVAVKAVGASRARAWAKVIGISTILAGAWAKFGSHFRMY